MIGKNALVRLTALILIVSYGASAKTPSLSSRDISLQAMNLTYHILKAESTIADSLESLKQSQAIPPDEVEKVAAFIKSKGALNASLDIKIDTKEGTFRIGHIELQFRDSGDLATKNGRFLGLNDNLSFSVLFERAFERLNEKRAFSKLDLLLDIAQAAEPSFVTSALDSVAAAYAAVNYAVERRIVVSLAAHYMTACVIDVGVFYIASEMDRIRNEKYGKKAGDFECDSDSPTGVRQYSPSIPEVAKRNRDREARSKQLKMDSGLPLKSPDNQKLKQCMDQLGPEQIDEAEKAAVLYDENEKVANIVHAYQRSIGKIGAKFNCTDTSVVELEKFERSLRLASSIRQLQSHMYRLSCLQNKNSVHDMDCGGTNILFAPLEKPEKKVPLDLYKTKRSR